MMAVQPNRTRVRAKAEPALPVPAEEAPCCQPVTVAHFTDQRLVGIYLRHIGRRCVGTMTNVPVRKWRLERGLR